MPENLASANVSRSYSLGATNIAILNFMLFFLFPKFENGRIDPWLFQFALVVMGVATFSLFVASFLYYRSSLDRTTEDERVRHSRQADLFWLIGSSVMFLAPGLVLYLIRLSAVASVWLVLWLVYMIFVMRSFSKVQTRR